MDRKPPQPANSEAGKQAANDRDARLKIGLKAALKANLQRRKAQAKKRGDEAKNK